MIPDTTHTDLQAADASEPHFNALVLEAGVAVYARPAWWRPGMRIVITRSETVKWGDFEVLDHPAYWSLEMVSAIHPRAGLTAGLPLRYTLGYAVGYGYTVQFEPTPQGGEVVVPV